MLNERLRQREIARRLGLSESAVSRHVKVLLAREYAAKHDHDEYEEDD